MQTSCFTFKQQNTTNSMVLSSVCLHTPVAIHNSGSGDGSIDFNPAKLTPCTLQTVKKTRFGVFFNFLE